MIHSFIHSFIYLLTYILIYIYIYIFIYLYIDSYKDILIFILKWLILKRKSKFPGGHCIKTLYLEWPLHIDFLSEVAIALTLSIQGCCCKNILYLRWPLHSVLNLGRPIYQHFLSEAAITLSWVVDAQIFAFWGGHYIKIL